MTLNFKKVYLWHLSCHHWERAMTKYENVSESFKNVHQRFLNKLQNKNKKRGFRPRKNDTIN